jgi:hypothetical protein
MSSFYLSLLTPIACEKSGYLKNKSHYSSAISHHRLSTATPLSSTLHILHHIPNHKVLGLRKLDHEARKFPAESDSDALLGANGHELHVGGDFLVDVFGAGSWFWRVS